MFIWISHKLLVIVLCLALKRSRSKLMNDLTCCRDRELVHAWWRHQMETSSALLPICAGNSPVTGEFPSQRPVTQSLDIFFDLRLNKRSSKQSRRRTLMFSLNKHLSKQSCGWWSETPSRSLRRHCTVTKTSHENTFMDKYLHPCFTVGCNHSSVTWLQRRCGNLEEYGQTDHLNWLRTHNTIATNKCTANPYMRIFYGIYGLPHGSFRAWVIALHYNVVSHWLGAYTNRFLRLHIVTGVKAKQIKVLQWRHNRNDSVSNHQHHDCLLSRLFRRRSKKTSKLRVTGLCAGNSPGTGEFPAQMASNAENVSIWWRHHRWWMTWHADGSKIGA